MVGNDHILFDLALTEKITEQNLKVRELPRQITDGKEFLTEPTACAKIQSRAHVWLPYKDCEGLKEKQGIETLMADLELRCSVSLSRKNLLPNVESGQQANFSCYFRVVFS